MRRYRSATPKLVDASDVGEFVRALIDLIVMSAKRLSTAVHHERRKLHVRARAQFSKSSKTATTCKLDFEDEAIPTTSFLYIYTSILHRIFYVRENLLFFASQLH
jgi:hypothetical protein